MSSDNHHRFVLRTGQHYVAMPKAAGLYEHLTAEQFAARVLRDNLLFGESGEMMALALVRLVLFGDRSEIEPLRTAINTELAEVAHLADNAPTLFN